MKSEDTDSAPDFDVESDANVLKKHTEIVGDKDRHSAAVQHLQKQQALHDTAVQNSKRQMHGRVKRGLKKAFGGGDDAGGKTPFEKAEDGE